MFIEIKKDIMDCALGGDELSLHVLQMVALGIQRGKNWYYLPRFNPISFKSLLSKRDLAILNSAADNDSNSLSKILSNKLIVTYDNNYNLKPGEKLYNPRKDNKFELYEEAHVICENLYDVDFYKLLMKYYVENHPKSKQIKKCKNRFLGRNGGGHTTAKVVERELKEEEHLFVVILDRDSKCPGYSVGDTARDVEELFNQYQAKFSAHYILQHHREAENLIPYPVLKSIGGNPLTKAMLDHCDMQWFDCKEGLKLSDLYGDNIYNHWKSEVGKIQTVQPGLVKFNISIRDNYREEDQKVKDYVEKCKVAGNPTFLHGWGKSILSDATSKITNSGQCPPHRRDLTNLQHEEWNNIGELIWHWTLSRDARI